MRRRVLQCNPIRHPGQSHGSCRARMFVRMMNNKPSALPKALLHLQTCLVPTALLAEPGHVGLKPTNQIFKYERPKITNNICCYQLCILFISNITVFCESWSTKFRHSSASFWLQHVSFAASLYPLIGMLLLNRPLHNGIGTQRMQSDHIFAANLTGKQWWQNAVGNKHFLMKTHTLEIQNDWSNVLPILVGGITVVVPVRTSKTMCFGAPGLG